MVRVETVVVGVNLFQPDGAAKPPLFLLDPEIEAAQIDSLRQVRASRNAAQVQERLCALESAAHSSDNLMPLIVQAAESYATVGEISDRLRNVFGEYRET
jgi:methylmalonyl-CoA mutase N-terminal domain/subunit